MPGNQRRRVHKTADLLASLPKSVEPKVKSKLREVWLAEDRESANKVLNGMLEKDGDKYPEVMKKWVKDQEELFAFYDFSEGHIGRQSERRT